MAVSNVEEARESIQELFQKLAIERVICVDDEYAHEKLGDIIVLIKSQGPEILKQVPQLESIPFTTDEDIMVERISSEWTQLDETTQDNIHKRILEIQDGAEKDPQFASVLDELLTGHEFLKFPLEEWEIRKASLLEEARDRKTLFLFDQNFEREGRSTTEGIRLIKSVLSSPQGAELMCGLLTHTSSSEAEHNRWQEISKEYDIELHRFVFVSKYRLTQDIMSFARMVKLTLLSKSCEDLKKKISAVIDESHRAAQDEIDQISVYDFEHIVFKSSDVEGIWEPDTLFRVFQLFQKGKVREKIRSEQELREIASRIRSVSAIATESAESPKHSSWKIRRLEIYEDAEYLNGFHIPIELGDIFEVVPTSNKYILLAQPCDLMIRSNGRRAYELDEAIIAKIKGPSGDSNQRLREHFFELPYFDKTTGDSHYVSLRELQTVKLHILDLCVYRKDGLAMLKLGDSYPAEALPTWKEHYKKTVSKLAEKTIVRFREASEALTGKGVPQHVANAILKQVVPGFSNNNLVEGSVDLTESSLSFPIKRVGRLNQSQAAAMLTKYANFYSRAAFEHDFGREYSV